MDRFFYILLVLLFVNMVQDHEQVVISSRIFTVMIQCANFPLPIFNGITLVIVILIKITANSSLLHALTIIIDRFKLNIAKTNKFRYICNINSEATIAKERKFPKYKNNYNCDTINDIHHSVDPNFPIRVAIKGNNEMNNDFSKTNIRLLATNVWKCQFNLNNITMEITVVNVDVQKRTSILAKIGFNIQFLLKEEKKDAVLTQNRA